MNKDEIAMDYKKELKKRISADYERRVKQWDGGRSLLS